MDDRVTRVLKDAGFTVVFCEDANQIDAIKCAYCRAEIECGQRWVREKVYQLTSCPNASYHCYHADPFPGHALSGWERHELEVEIDRINTCAA